MSPFFEDLEAQLRAAAHDHAPPPRRRWLRSGLRAAPVALAVATTVAVAVAALLLIGHGQGNAPAPAGAPTSSPSLGALLGQPTPRLHQELSYIDRATRRVMASPGCQVRFPPRVGSSQGTPSPALVSILGVLRRPATASDRLPPDSVSGGERVYVRYVRRALVRAGVAYYIVPVRSLPGAGGPPRRCFAREISALHAELPQIPTALRRPTVTLQARMIAFDTRLGAPQDGICFVSEAGNGSASSGCADSAAQVAHGPGIQGDNEYLSGVVPDGVTTVTLRYPATHQQAALSVTTGVGGNVFAVRVARARSGELPATIVWRSAQGAVVRTIDETSHGVPRGFCRRNRIACLPASSQASSSSSSSAPGPPRQR